MEFRDLSELTPKTPFLSKVTSTGRGNEDFNVSFQGMQLSL